MASASQPTAPRRAAASSSSASQPTEPIKTSQPDVPEVAEAKTSINPKVEGLVAEVKELGHFPDRTAPAENSFYQRLLRKRKLFSEEQWENLKNIGASQPVEVEQLVAEVRELEHFHKRKVKEVGYCLEVQREVVCAPEFGKLIWLQQPEEKNLLEEVLSFGCLPRQVKKLTHEPERRENQLRMSSGRW